MLMTVGIFSVVKLLALLRRAVQGHLPVDGLGMILTFKLATFLDVILTPAVFIAIMLVMMRWSRDNEITIFATSGVGPLDYLLPAAVVAVGATFVVAILSLYVAPYAELGYEHEIEKYRLTTKSAPFKKGDFRKIDSGRSVLYYSHYADEVEDPLRLFYLRAGEAKQSIIVAQRGSYNFDLNERVEQIEIRDGALYQFDPDTLDYQDIGFDVFVERSPTVGFEDNPIHTKAKPTARLIKSEAPQDKAELSWRLSKVLAMTLVVLLAFAWGSSAARSKMGINLIGGIVVYFVYSSVLGFTAELVRNKEITSGWLSAIPHFAMIILIVGIFVRSYYNRSLASAITSRRA